MDTKEKAEKTLERMKQIRIQDQAFIRNLIKDKLTWAREQKEKGIVFINKLQQRINETKLQIMKIDACITVLEELDVAKIKKPRKKRTKKSKKDK